MNHRARRALAVVPVLALVATMLGVLGAPAANAAPPQNDDVANATVLDFGTVGGIVLTEATESGDEPIPQLGDCAFGTNRTVWFKITTDRSRTIRLSTAGSSDTVVALYSGPTTNPSNSLLSEVGCDDDSGPSLDARLTADVVSGTTYYVQLGAFGSSAATTNLSLEAVVPANDNLDAAATIAQVNAVNNADATLEGGEPTGQSGCGQLNNSVWFKFTPTVAGNRTLETSGEALGDTVLRLYTGPAGTPSFGALSFVGCDDDSGTGAYSLLSRPVTADTTYYVQVGSYFTSGNATHLPPGPFTLSFRDPAVDPPSNDDVAFPDPITASGQASGGTFSTSTVNATEMAGEASPAAGSRSVWLRWTAPYDGPVVFDTANSPAGLDTYLCVFPPTGAVNAVGALACNNDVNPMDVRSRISFTATRQTAYRILVSTAPGAGSQVLGSYSYQPPGNDDRATATAISGATGSINGDNRFATIAVDDPTIPDTFSNPKNSVWYAWTAPSTGGFVFETAPTAASDSSSDTILAVYPSTGPLTQIASNDDIAVGTGNYFSRLDFGATAGTTYLVRVDGYGISTSDPFVLSWSPFTATQTTTVAPLFDSVSGAEVTYSLTVAFDDPSQTFSLAGRFDVRRLGETTVLDSVNTSDGTATVTLPMRPGGNTYEFTFVPADYHVHPSDALASRNYVAPTTLTFEVTGGDNRVTLYARPDAVDTGIGGFDPTGTIMFEDENGDPVGGGPLVGGFYETTVTGVPRGQHSYTATFTPADELAYGPSSAGPTSTTVVDDSTTALTTAVSGLKVTLTATITPEDGPPPAAGTVEFFEGSASRGTATVSSGAATLVLSNVVPGTHTYRAVFTPSGSEISGSTSPDAVAVVKKLASKTTITAPSKVTAGATPSIVIGVAVGAAKGAGKVTVTLNGKVVKTVTLKKGKATVKLPPLKAGKAKIVATYLGSSTVAGSKATKTITVAKKK